MHRISIFQRRILTPALVMGLVTGLFALNSLTGRTAFRRTESDQHSKQINFTQPQNSLDHLPVYFEENRGLAKDKVRYLARGNGGAMLFLTATEAVYVLRSPASVDSPTSVKNQKPKSEDAELAVCMKLSGANENAVFAGEEQLQHRTNYITGSDSRGWQTGVPNYRRVVVNDIYDGVDMVWQGKTRGEVQYDFIVKPNADPAQIEWRIEGARNVSIDADGSLLIETELGALRQGKPFSYQDSDGLRTEVKSSYVVSGNLTSNTAERSSFTVRFEVGDYDRSMNLTIDPSVNLSNLAFSTLLGGNGEDRGYSIAVDSAGSVYVTGRTLSTQFPTTAGTVDTSQTGDRGDVFVTKLSASGTLIYSTFIGGNSFEQGTDIAIDSSGNAYLTGATASADFPTTSGAFGTTLRGTADVFVTKLNASGSALVYSGIIGGTASEAGQSIAIDSSGNAYLTGVTDSADFPVMAGAFDGTHNGSGDVFVAKLNPTGATVIYSTFIGGSAFEGATGIAIDSLGNSYLTGSTGSTNYPTTAAASDTTYGGMNDVFVTKLNASGSGLLYSTFLGGNSFESGTGIAIDSSGNYYVTGLTGSANYPTRPVGAFDTTFDGGAAVFVTKLDPRGALDYSTFIGGTSGDSVAGIAVDASGNAYLTGSTSNPRFPTTPGAFDTTHNGLVDVFVTKLNPRGTALVYSTFIGGGSGELARAIAIDSSGNIYLTGDTIDFPGVVANYPTTSESHQPKFNGGPEVFVSKLGDFAISGQAVDETGQPLANVAIAMSGARLGFMLTDGQGYFGFTDTVARGDFTVGATHPNLNFTPNNFQIDSFTRNQDFVFLGRR